MAEYETDTHSFLCLDVLVDTARVRHVSQHDFANLQGGFSEANLQNLDVPPLRCSFSCVFQAYQQHPTYLSFVVAILHRQQPLREEHL